MDISYTLQDIIFEWDEAKADSNIENIKFLLKRLVKFSLTRFYKAKMSN